MRNGERMLILCREMALGKNIEERLTSAIFPERTEEANVYMMRARSLLQEAKQENAPSSGSHFLMHTDMIVNKYIQIQDEAWIESSSERL